MKTGDGFLAFVLDQLDGIDDIVSRPMFGGTGLYAGTVFFGIIFNDILYVKVDGRTRADSVRAGMKPEA
jgi:DNA transformation protein and related proteins